MCLVAFSWQNHSEYPLVISANRDEFFERPTAPLQLWESDFIAGKDLRGGGTWMGFHLNGRWSFLTNYRDFRKMGDCLRLQQRSGAGLGGSAGRRGRQSGDYGPHGGNIGSHCRSYPQKLAG
jgi:hypothetical protein